MKTGTVLFLLLAFSLALLTGSSPAAADLGGSNVTFAGAVGGGAACYVPGRANNLCFRFDTSTTDGQPIAYAFFKLPENWTLGVGSALNAVGTPSCDGGGSFGTGYYGGTGGSGYFISQPREQKAPDHCSATYCFQVNASADTTGNAAISWSWYGENGDTSAPYHPCSSGGFVDPTGIACDETINPPATVPVCEPVSLNVLPETLPAAEAGVPYSQPISVEGGSGPYSWGWQGTLPDGIGFGLVGSGSAIGGIATTPGVYNFTILVGDSGGSQGSREYALVVVPSQNRAPTVTCPPASMQEATGPGGAGTDISVAVGDLDNDPLIATWYVDSGAVDMHGLPAGATSDGLTQSLILGSHTVRVSVSDGKADPVSCDTTVTVQDTTPPAIDAHAGVTAQATGPAGAYVSYTSPATHDLVDGTGAAACLPASGSLFALGDTTVTCSATDARDNAAAPTTFAVHVQAAAPSQLTPSSATCRKFKAGTAADLTQLLYTANRNGAINWITPGAFGYFARLTAPNAGAFNLTVAQSNDSGFPAMIPVAYLVALYDGNCNLLSPRAASVRIESGRNVRINFAPGPGGRTITVLVRYFTAGVYGRKVTGPYPMVNYTFSAALAAGSPFTQDTLALKPQ
jgi:hypothetical protein